MLCFGCFLVGRCQYCINGYDIIKILWRLFVHDCVIAVHCEDLADVHNDLFFHVSQFQDQSNTDIFIGVMSSGIRIYRNRVLNNYFPWWVLSFNWRAVEFLFCFWHVSKCCVECDRPWCRNAPVSVFTVRYAEEQTLVFKPLFCKKSHCC